MRSTRACGRDFEPDDVVGGRNGEALKNGGRDRDRIVALCLFQVSLLECKALRTELVSSALCSLLELLCELVRESGRRLANHGQGVRLYEPRLEKVLPVSSRPVTELVEYR